MSSPCLNPEAHVFYVGPTLCPLFVHCARAHAAQGRFTWVRFRPQTSPYLGRGNPVLPQAATRWQPHRKEKNGAGSDNNSPPFSASYVESVVTL